MSASLGVLIAAVALLSSGLGGLARDARAGDAPDISTRLDELEKKQDAIFEQQASDRGKVETFLEDRLLLGGFFESAVTGIWGSGTNTQFSAAPDTLAINLAADFNETWHFNSQLQLALTYPLQNPDNLPVASSSDLPPARAFSALSTPTSLPQGYLEYSSDPAFLVQAGRGYSPFGIAFQLRDLVLFRRRGGPQLINANTGTVVIASALWTGVHLGGTFRAGESNWGYDAYTLTPSSNPATMGGGGRLWLAPARELTVGVSDQIGKRGAATYEAFGADIKFKRDHLGADAEAAINLTGEGVGVSRTFYVEPYYEFFEGRIVAYLAADYLDAPTAETIAAGGAIPDPFRKWELGGGLNWLPYSFTRFRVGLIFNDYGAAYAQPDIAERDYVSLDVSAGVEF